MVHKRTPKKKKKGKGRNGGLIKKGGSIIGKNIPNKKTKIETHGNTSWEHTSKLGTD